MGEYGDLYHVSDSKNRKPILLEIYLKGRPVTMELDTGSAVLFSVRGCIQSTCVMFL